MELSVTQENLASALSTASRIASAKAGLPILGNILLRTDKTRLLVAATNLELASTQYIGAKVSKSGSITVPARLINEFITSLPKVPVELRVENDKLHIVAGDYTSTINGVIADEFPELPTINEQAANNYTVPVQQLKSALQETIFTASNDSTRPVLTGVYWYTHEDSLYLAATDGYRLSERRLQLTKSTIAAIIPTQTLQEVLRTLNDDSDDITILIDENQVRFRIDDTEITSRLIDGAYPNYRQLIPAKSEFTATIDHNDFARVVKIASLFARDSGGSITISIDSDSQQVSVRSIASEFGENTSTITATVSASSSITLNSRYLTEVLAVITGETITLGFGGKLSPCVMTADGNDSFKHIIMPLKS